MKSSSKRKDEKDHRDNYQGSGHAWNCPAADPVRAGRCLGDAGCRRGGRR